MSINLVLIVGAVVFLVAYVVWRRRRNKRLTGLRDNLALYQHW